MSQYVICAAGGPSKQQKQKIRCHVLFITFSPNFRPHSLTGVTPEISDIQQSKTHFKPELNDVFLWVSERLF